MKNPKYHLDEQVIVSAPNINEGIETLVKIISVVFVNSEWHYKSEAGNFWEKEIIKSLIINN